MIILLSDYLIVESLENAINAPKKKKKEIISISTSLKIRVVTIEGLKEDFWGAGTVSLLDLVTGDKRCIHFVKIDLAEYFVMLPQKNK